MLLGPFGHGHTAPRARSARGDCPVASPVGASRLALAMRYECLFQGPLSSRPGGLRTRRSDARLILIVVTPLAGIPNLPSPYTRMLHSRNPAVSGFLIADSTAGARLSPRPVGRGPAIRLIQKTLGPTAAATSTHSRAISAYGRSWSSRTTVSRPRCGVHEVPRARDRLRRHDRV